MSDIIIARGFNGPRLSGNGGYVSGLLANRFTDMLGGDGTVEITLRAPIPIDKNLQVGRDGEALMLRDGDTLICEARAGSVAHLTPPPAPTDWGPVLRVGETGGSIGDEFQECLVCGRGRGVGDGLRVFGQTGSGGGHSLSCYVPHAAHADDSGHIKSEFIWGTLDCPGAWAVQTPDDPRPALTGRMTAKIIDPPKVGERCAVVGWKIGEDGRKL